MNDEHSFRFNRTDYLNYPGREVTYRIWSKAQKRGYSAQPQSRHKERRRQLTTIQVSKAAPPHYSTGPAAPSSSLHQCWPSEEISLTSLIKIAAGVPDIRMMSYKCLLMETQSGGHLIPLAFHRENNQRFRRVQIDHYYECYYYDNAFSFFLHILNFPSYTSL